MHACLFKANYNPAGIRITERSQVHQWKAVQRWQRIIHQFVGELVVLALLMNDFPSVFESEGFAGDEFLIDSEAVGQLQKTHTASCDCIFPRLWRP